MQELWSTEPFNLPGVDHHAAMSSILQMFRRVLTPELFLVGVRFVWKVWEVRNTEVHGCTNGFPLMW